MLFDKILTSARLDGPSQLRRRLPADTETKPPVGKGLCSWKGEQTFLTMVTTQKALHLTDNNLRRPRHLY